MRKKALLLGLFTLISLGSVAQDIQLHYDFGRNIYTGEEAGRQPVHALTGKVRCGTDALGLTQQPDRLGDAVAAQFPASRPCGFGMERP